MSCSIRLIIFRTFRLHLKITLTIELHNSTFVYNIANMRKALILIAVVLTGLAAEAQYYTDYGFMVGVSSHRGDINKANSLSPHTASRANAVLGGYYRYKFSSLISARAQISLARLSGDDANADPADFGRIARNLSFRTDLVEFAGIAEFHILDIKDFGGTGRYTTFFNVYGFTGVGFSYYNPMAKRDNGEWVDLRPLMTEGVKYSSITPIIPIGVGAHFTFNRKWRLGAEIGYRITFTDYLDDVSGNYLTWDEYNAGDPLTKEMAVRYDYDYIESHPEYFPENYATPEGGRLGGVRGNPEDTDYYLFGTVNVGFMIRGKSNFYRSKYQYTKGRGKKKRRSRAKF